MAHIEKSMFREYDIRGRVTPGELNSQTGELIGKAYGTFLKKRNVDDVVMGHDSRIGSEDVKKGFIEGLLSTGRNVTDIGLCLTPMMYWAQYYLKTKGGAMVTGSHNPKGWTGLKLACGLSYTLIGDEIREILSYINDDAFASGSGKLTQRTIKDAWVDDLAGRVRIERPLRVVVDCGNGTAGAFGPDVLRKAGLEVIEQFCELDPEDQSRVIDAVKAFAEAYDG